MIRPPTGPNRTVTLLPYTTPLRWPSTRSATDTSRDRAGHPDQIRRGEAEVEAAPPTGDIDDGVLERTRVEHGRVGLLLADRGDAPDHVAGRSLFRRRVGHREARSRSEEAQSEPQSTMPN